MSYLLDTNVCIRYLNGSSESVRQHLELISPTNVMLCSVVKSELLTGACKSKNKQKTLEKLEKFFAPLLSFPFDDKAAETCCVIRSDLESKGTPIGPYDLQIASIAIANDLILVTHNQREFRKNKRPPA